MKAGIRSSHWTLVPHLHENLSSVSQNGYLMSNHFISSASHLHYYLPSQDWYSPFKLLTELAMQPDSLMKRSCRLYVCKCSMPRIRWFSDFSKKITELFSLFFSHIQARNTDGTGNVSKTRLHVFIQKSLDLFQITSSPPFSNNFLRQLE